MKSKPSRRTFLQAGLMLPAAELISSGGREAFSQEPAGVAYRMLGRTGLKVSGVGFGLGFTPDPDIVARAIELGVNYFDTSRVYGQGASERIFGAAIKGKRDTVVISTKTGSRTKADILKDMDTSLQTLGTDHVDVYHLHARDTPQRAPEEAIEACTSSSSRGKPAPSASARMTRMSWRITSSNRNWT